MAIQLNQYMSVSDVVQAKLGGRLYHLFDTVIFDVSDTTQYVYLTIPDALTVQIIAMDLSFVDHFDNTLQLTIYENPIGLTAGAAFHTRNMNRNFDIFTYPSLFYFFHATGPMTSYDVVLETFTPQERKTQFIAASNLNPDITQRILQNNGDYCFEFTRAADTIGLTLNLNFLCIQSS